ncbi:MAG: universal stress protein, partial [Thermoanaerobaculia bacterium]
MISSIWSFGSSAEGSAAGPPGSCAASDAEIAKPAIATRHLVGVLILGTPPSEPGPAHHHGAEAQNFREIAADAIPARDPGQAPRFARVRTVPQPRIASAPPVVVGFDGSPDARRAVVWAAAVARARGGRALHLVHALALPAIPHHGWEHLTVRELLDGHEREMRERLVAERDALAADGLEVEVHLRRWLPAETLIEHAENRHAGLIVVGRHGAGASHLVLGSVSGAVARGAHIPVVVVRGETRPSPPARVLAALDGSA